MSEATAAPAADVTTAAPIAATPAPAPTTTIAAPAAPAAASAAPAAPSPTISQAAPVDAGAAPVADAPDWRKAIAGEDADHYKRLERFASPAELYKSYRSLEQKLSGGEQQPQAAALPENPTPEQIAEYRKANGIPDTPDGYKIEFPNGFQAPDADRPMIDHYKQLAHQNNWSNEQLVGMLTVGYQVRGAMEQQRQLGDEESRLQGLETLRREYGNDFQRNMNAWYSFRDTMMPTGFADRLAMARLPDGRLLGNDPEFIRWGVQTAIDFNPASTVLPAGTTNQPQALNDEIARIEQMQRDPDQSRVYYKDQAIQDKYLRLIEARNKMGGRAA
jgi:hypothetical protein